MFEALLFIVSSPALLLRSKAGSADPKCDSDSKPVR